MFSLELSRSLMILLDMCRQSDCNRLARICGMQRVNRPNGFARICGHALTNSIYGAITRMTIVARTSDVKCNAGCLRSTALETDVGRGQIARTSDRKSSQNFTPPRQTAGRDNKHLCVRQGEVASASLVRCSTSKSWYSVLADSILWPNIVAPLAGRWRIVYAAWAPNPNFALMNFGSYTKNRMTRPGKGQTPVLDLRGVDEFRASARTMSRSRYCNAKRF